ncbi:hypothetical protein LOCC1_G000552 [Lachnellula occidentalis]|uniref:Uncharacterized protein n=1 Tax=Lachnellula occidentalis TaxID=215460 RepID=A0A8H8UI54_9HELO|nr:hypothetical protein LOCC1_G000552 [Lachnellula occidentalis]
MDSMRSLNTSLPGAGTSSARQQTVEPPGNLIQAFRSAALSITTLYKTAADDLGKSRAEGYQDALDDLLTFLDKQDIGLSDGEGWRIRQWATEKLDGRDSVSQHAESDDEAVEKAEAAPSSPILQRSQSDTRLNTNPQPTRTTSPMRTESSGPPTAASTPAEVQAPSVPQQGAFTFRSSQQYPQDADIVLDDLNITDNTRSQSHGPTHSSNNPGITISRPSRTGSRHSNHSARLGSRVPSAVTRVGHKRKANLPDFDFFDIGTLDYGKDGSGGGGGKRGRFA